MRTPALGLSVLCAFVLGCSDVAGTTEDASIGGPYDAAAAEIQLGTGESGFETLNDLDDIELIAGPQGGWHILLSLRIYNLPIDDMIVRYEGIPVGESGPINYPTAIQLNAARVVREGDHWLRAGDFLIFEIEEPANVVGLTLDVSVSAMANNGQRVNDMRRVRVVDRQP